MSRSDDERADQRVTELLSQSLSEEAAMVDPSPGGLQSIQQRTEKQSPVRNPWVIGSFGAGLATAAVITAVVLISTNGGDGNGTSPPIATQPTDSTEPTETPEPTTVPLPAIHPGVYDPDAESAHQFTMYYGGPLPENRRLAPRLYAETHTVETPGDDTQLAAVNEFLTSTPIDPDYESYWPPGVIATDVTEAAGVTTVAFEGTAQLTDRPILEVVGERPLQVALEALLATLDPPGAAAFTYNGEPMETLMNQDVSPSVERASDNDVRAWITIDNIVEGQTVSSPVSVVISGNVFEGNVNWYLEDGAGAQVSDGYVMTSMGMWTAATADLGALAPGTYTFTALEYSAEDGSPTNVDTKTFTVE